MTIEEIERELKGLRHFEDMAMWASKYGEKLIAVAKAAYQIRTMVAKISKEYDKCGGDDVFGEVGATLSELERFINHEKEDDNDSTN